MRISVRFECGYAYCDQKVIIELGEMQDYFEDRSESWQVGERGEEHQAKIASVEAALDALSDLTS